MSTDDIDADKLSAAVDRLQRSVLPVTYGPKVTVTIRADIGGETYTGSGTYSLGGCTISSADDLTGRLPVLLRGIARIMENPEGDRP